MIREHFHPARLAAAVVLAILSMAAPVSASKQGKPNVLFIANDDLNDWTGFMGGHPQASTPKRKYFDKFGKVEPPLVPEDDLDDIPAAGRRFAGSLVGFSSCNDHAEVLKVPGAWQELVHAYLATSSFADANVGRLLGALESSPHKEHTIVVLWGDHGWHLGEKRHWRKMTLWERGTRTPFIIAAPAVKARRVEDPVSLQDIFPTLVELCHLELKQELDGNSLKPLLMDASPVWDKPVLMSHGPGNFAVRQGPWRLIRYADRGEELYELEEDPGEWENLAGRPEYGARVERLRKHLPTTWRYLMGQRFQAFPDSFAKPPQLDPSP